MENEEIIDLNTVCIGLRQALEQREDINQELNKNKLANYVVRTENYTGIITIVEKK